MSIAQLFPKLLVVGVVAAGVGLLISRQFENGGEKAAVALVVPPLTPTAELGKASFDTHCAQCHGANAAGTNQGPPLVHDIYNPGHHADQAFWFAVRRGVRQHHWPYGNMPPQPQVTDQELPAIVRYVRELQEANGIAYRPHRM